MSIFIISRLALIYSATFSPVYKTLAIINILATDISQAPVYKIVMLQQDIIFQLSIHYVFALYPGILHLDPLMLYSTFSVGVLQAPVYKIVMLQQDIIFQLSIHYVFALYPGILHLDPLMLYSTFSVGVFHNIQNAYI